MSLKDRTILVTRQPEQAAEMITEIKRRGGRTVLFPTIVTVPPESWEACDRVLGVLGSFDVLLITSANAAGAFFDRFRSRHIDLELLKNLKVFAIGEKTQRTLQRLGVPVDMVPESFNGRALAEALPDNVVRGKRILFPCGNLAPPDLADALRGRGAEVDTVVVYHTIQPQPADVDTVQDRIFKGDIDVVSFASPSAVENFVRMMSRLSLTALRNHARIAVIGPTTRDAVERLGGTVDIVARESTARGLVKAMEKYYREMAHE
jgi:uroporphyrinogen-III synthase